MIAWVWVGAGGFLGAILRYYVSGWIQNGWVTFPMGTLGVNFLGSFFLSLVMYLAEWRGWFSEEVRIFLTIGVLGAFTTMSTFGYESFRLLEQQETLLFCANVFGSVGLALLGVYLGRAVVYML